MNLKLVQKLQSVKVKVVDQFEWAEIVIRHQESMHITLQSRSEQIKEELGPYSPGGEESNMSCINLAQNCATASSDSSLDHETQEATKTLEVEQNEENKVDPPYPADSFKGGTGRKATKKRSPCPDKSSNVKTKETRGRKRKYAEGDGESNAALKCPECPRTFIYPSRLKNHERIHSGKKPFFCLECGKTFAYRGHLDIHKRTHTGDKPYSCSYCNKRFSQLSILNVHERRHTGEKPYKCMQCDERFAQLANLKAHQRKHTRVMPFGCPDCHLCFANQANLQVHRRTHTGERPFVCLMCWDSFTQRGNLMTHMKKHENTNCKVDQSPSQAHS